MFLEDFMEATSWRADGNPPPPDKWVDELRHQAMIESFADAG